MAGKLTHVEECIQALSEKDKRRMAEFVLAGWTFAPAFLGGDRPADQPRVWVSFPEWIARHNDGTARHANSLLTLIDFVDLFMETHAIGAAPRLPDAPKSLNYRDGKFSGDQKPATN